MTSGNLNIRRQVSDERIPALFRWIDGAYSDYLASRVLLNANQLVQGAILASTAIEKYSKAVLLIKGDTVRGHLREGHLNGLRNFDGELYSSLNQSFLKLLREAYVARYYEDIPKGYHIQIFQYKFLAELDYSVYQFQGRFSITLNGKPVRTAFVDDVETKDIALWQNNYLLERMNRKKFIFQEQAHFDLFRNEYGILGVSGFAGNIPDDGNFEPLTNTPDFAHEMGVTNTG